ncbi:prolipoprotein diacylglyceryl transferase [Sporobacter termitidis]|uniref:prolipoprotein diacylglyceryl transferase n=1 Tax=Sporobacter termitidis TaxID=44749 RepID=UPI001FA8EA62|nr:prolipoprotein diacylglyceryl transferase [Sporobacter termitidis]
MKISFPMFGSQFVLDPPRYFMVFGRPVYWYAVIIVAGFLLATLYIMKRRREFGLSQDNVLDLFIYAVVSGVVGARLYYVIFNPADYIGPGKWLNIFKVWEGGLAIYGGIIAAVICIFFYARSKKLPVLVFFDVGGLGLLIGQAVGRWGNFMNREAFGGRTDLPWKMGLTTAQGTVYVHPTFLYESLWNILGFILIHIFSKKYRKYDGQVFLAYLAWYGFGRFFIEGLRTDSLYLFHTDIRVSQLVAALTFCAAVFILLRNQLRRKFTPEDLYVNRAGPDKAHSAKKNQEETDGAGAEKHNADMDAAFGAADE